MSLAWSNSMRKIAARTSGASYTIHVDAGLLSEAGRLLTGMADRCVVITDSTTGRLHGAALERGLRLGGRSPTMLEVADGEHSKSLETAARLYEDLDAARVERSTCVLALGGGMVGDLAGFVAATYLRGLPFVQVPTTLLAQVDSGIGGKVAVNHKGLKNKIGTFYQPALVLSDVYALRTLGAREFAGGVAEVIKTAVVQDGALFRYLEDHLDELMRREVGVLEEVVARCAQDKATVVEQDERDLGTRHILNYGHTVGHALEAVSGFSLAHGQAVAVGMVLAARVARSMGLLTDSQVAKISHMVTRAGLPSTVEGLDRDAVMDAMYHDKKVVGGRLRLVLPTSIGQASVTDRIPISVLESELRAG